MKKLISMLLAVVLCLSFSVVVFADEFVDSPSELPDDCIHGTVELVGKKDPTCTTDGYTGDEVCTHCGKVIKKGSVIPKLGHNFKDGVCTVCGAKEAAPKTGDNSNMVLWTGMMLAAAVALCAVAVNHKKFTVQ